MLGINYFKADPSTYVMLFKNGNVQKQGAGTSFYYYSPTSSLVAVPLSSKEVPFAFRMNTKDFQVVTVQGQVTFRISEPEQAAKMLNLTVNAKGKYETEDPEKIEERVIRSVQVVVRNEMEKQSLQAALMSAQALSSLLQSELAKQPSLESLGIEINQASLTAISPTPETGKALEADILESLLKEADSAIYSRRLASIDQEKQVKQRELETEKAITKQQQELEQQKLEAEREQMQQRFEMNQESIGAQTQDERKRAELVELESSNARARADAKAYEIKSQLEAYEQIDIECLKVMSMGSLKPEQLIAQAIENLTQGENRVGNLNISPELLQSLTKPEQYNDYR
ncbi:SPFH domain-containing protein [Vibrio hannami]|uniref:SPFH domain-containing protein n=2 Tax=Vibrio hannami TaxID=2717094 RepID=UPI003EBD1EE6